jgi:hypothetical protein
MYLKRPETRVLLSITPPTDLYCFDSVMCAGFLARYNKPFSESRYLMKMTFNYFFWITTVAL